MLTRGEAQEGADVRRPGTGVGAVGGDERERYPLEAEPDARGVCGAAVGLGEAEDRPEVVLVQVG